MTDGKHTGAGDCTQCQKTTRTAKDSTLWNIDALQTALDTNSWSIASDDSWQLLLAVLKRSGFSGRAKPRVPHRHTAEEQATACAVLPSRVTIAVHGALAVALKACWLLHTDGVVDKSLERAMLILKFVAWASKGAENRRVLLHHEVLQTLSVALAGIHKRNINPFIGGEAASEVTDRDIRTCDWQSELQG
ncbi:hypothetical protein EC988_006040, partial [Linderina pennispora]